MIDMELRPQTDLRNESMGYKIREAVSQKPPYVCVFGKNEIENNSVSVRKRGEKDSVTMKLEEFYALLKEDVKFKR